MRRGHTTITITSLTKQPKMMINYSHTVTIATAKGPAEGTSLLRYGRTNIFLHEFWWF